MKTFRTDLLFPELSYKIIGCCFNVYNSIGPGHLEKVYQRALAEAFISAGLSFTEQEVNEVTFQNKTVGKGSSDFLVEKSIIVEIKRGNYFNPADFEQVQKYLQMKNLSLGLLIRFTPAGVKYKRVVNVEIPGNPEPLPENIATRSVQEKTSENSNS